METFIIGANEQDDENFFPSQYFFVCCVLLLSRSLVTQSEDEHRQKTNWEEKCDKFQSFWGMITFSFWRCLIGSLRFFPLQSSLLGWLWRCQIASNSQQWMSWGCLSFIEFVCVAWNIEILVVESMRISSCCAEMFYRVRFELRHLINLTFDQNCQFAISSGAKKTNRRIVNGMRLIAWPSSTFGDERKIQAKVTEG